MRGLSCPSTQANFSDLSLQGVSVIIPTYRGGALLRRALASVVSQTLNHELIEVIVVENGTKGDAHSVLNEFSGRKGNGSIRWRYLYSDMPGAGRARNIGIAASTGGFITFLDDDDWIEAEYLKRLHECASENTVTISGIRDERAGAVTDSNSLDDRIAALPKSAIDIGRASWALGFNASKLIPRNIMGTHAFSERLESGEDVVFFAKLLEKSRLKIRVVDDLSGARYVRMIGNETVSRQDPSFDFSVKQRLDVIESLSNLTVASGREDARAGLIEAQIRFIMDYLAVNKTDREVVYDAISRRAIPQFPWHKFERGQADELVFSYCFPPDADTSSNVMAKRILNRREMVDVVSNDMARVRARDESMYAVVRRWINQHYVVGTPTSFSDWDAISAWAEKAVRAVDRRRVPYRKMYSRAMWVGSHVAAIKYKSLHPETHWVAEFSDPLSRGADGELRSGSLGRNRLARLLIEKVGEERDRRPKTLFEATEETTLLMADEIVFTNGNQKKMILEAYPDSFAEFVDRKSRVSGQPIPPEFLYDLRQCSYPLSPEVINIGYFGAFYPNRGIGNVAAALKLLPNEDLEKIRLHVFSDSEFDIEDCGPVANRIVLNSYRPYLEFLNLSAKMDVLLVTDTSTTGAYTCNPFLPSKYADYRGADVSVWGIVEDKSPLSECELEFMTEQDSPASIAETLSNIIEVCSPALALRRPR